MGHWLNLNVIDQEEGGLFLLNARLPPFGDLCLIHSPSIEELDLQVLTLDP